LLPLSAHSFDPPLPRPGALTLEEQQALADEAAGGSAALKRSKSAVGLAPAVPGRTSSSAAAGGKRRATSAGAYLDSTTSKKLKEAPGDATVEISALHVRSSRQETDAVDVLNDLEDDFLK